MSDRFERYYGDLFGDRWTGLRDALLAEPSYVELSDGLLQGYHMDGASYHTARVLAQLPGTPVLDMCAAPGGKTLVLARSLGDDYQIVANEKSAGRRSRLGRVLDEHLSPDVRRRVQVTGYDGVRFGLHRPNAFARVLVDVPCSSERHILSSQTHLAKWSPARTKHLSIQAYSLLSSALMSTRQGGYVLYSTCALSPLENDAVIAKAQHRFGDRILIVSPELPVGRRTDHGWEVTPDRDAGMGPMYAALLHKV